MDIILKIYEKDLPVFDEIDIITFGLASLNSDNNIYIKDIKKISDEEYLVVMSNNSNYQIKTYLEQQYNTNINPNSLIPGSVFEYQEILTTNDDYTIIIGIII